jgi:hypothetical protein
LSTLTREDNESDRYSCLTEKSCIKRGLFPHEDQLRETRERLDIDEEDVASTVLKSLPTGCTLERGTTIIQEQIETIITTKEGLEEDHEEVDLNNIPTTNSRESTTSSLISEVRPRSSTHRYHRNILYEDTDAFDTDSPLSAICLNLEPAIRVPFPELGVDIIDFNYRPVFPKEVESEISRGEEDSRLHSSKIRLTDLTSWEENWLFRKKKNKPCSHINSYLTLCDLDFASEPLRMLIPNPCQVTQTLIGDEDVKDIHDLSERNSVASLVFSSLGEEEEEEETHQRKEFATEKCEKDFQKSKSLDSSPRNKTLHHQQETLEDPSSSSTTVMTQGLKGKSDDHRQHNSNNPDNNSKKSTVVVISRNVKHRSNNEETDHVPVNYPATPSKSREEVNRENSSHDSNADSIVRNGREESRNLNNMRSREDLHQNGGNRSYDNNSKGSKKPSFVYSNHKPPPSSSSSSSKAYFTSSCMNQETVRRDIRDSETRRRSSSGSEITLPVFVPLSERMESSRSDPSFVIKPCGASVQTDIIIQFCCRVKGSRPLGVAWFKGDTLLTTGDAKFRIFSSGNEFVLEIKSTSEDDSDTYSCVVYNGFGEQWADFNLTVKRVKERITPASHRAKQSVSHLIISSILLST